MQLEVLRAPARGTPRPVDLLLVHGICVGAWIWERHFLPGLAAAGYNVHALSLRGHAGSPGRDGLHGYGLAHYAEDVRAVAAEIGRPVVVVGHSLGGAVVQTAIAGGARFAGAVLMASVPPYGLWPANLAMLTRHPRLWREVAVMSVAGVRHADPAVLRDGLFANRISAAEFAAFAARAHDESRFIGLELQGWRPFAPPAWMAPPMLVMGGGEDRFVGLSDLWMTAAWYGTNPDVLPGLSHTMMMDPDWPRALDCILAWLERNQVSGGG
ncbi:putative Lysophospholipase [Rhodovastum atsumiense]|nr:alpha/beta fold hydrolase [Rhodovastum atsumiense]CAH2600445.1 putative Lysophospholipase [Rhodovastum atsumiense]